MNLIQRVAHINPAEKVLAPNRVKLLQKCKNKASQGKGMQRWAIKELLEANLCTTMTSNEEKTLARLPKCMEVYRHILELEELEVKAQGSANPGERVPVEQCNEIIAEIDVCETTFSDVKSGFICEMIDFYPLHDAKELQSLMKEWADFSNMWRWKMPNPVDEGTHIIDSWAMFYQPTSKVRDYFGDHTALYFAWLQLYTCWLRYAALIGAFVMFGNYYGDNGIDGNPFVLAYSIFLSLWSTLFVEAWTNRENELRCLWGSAGFEAQEQPRPQFRGMIREDPMTKVKQLVHESDLQRYAKTAVSQAIILCCIMLVIFGAYGAYAIRQIKKVTEESCINPCHQLQLDWAATAQFDDWTDFDFVMAKQMECESILSERDRFGDLANVTRDQSSSFCAFSRPAAGAENGGCVEAQWWLNGTLCAGDKVRFKFDQQTMPKGSREYQYRFGADLSDQSTEVSRKNCEEATGVRGDCIYTPYLLDGVEINPTWWERTKWKLLSSLINLILIQGGGQIYERLAGFLNEWENHRTETEYTDSLIFKAFGFQFVNNYFTLFYIAFLIHFQIFPGMKTGCDGHTSCMGELQWQLFIVFSGKTMMKKVVEVSKPFIRSCVKGFGAKRVARTNQVVDATMKVKNTTEKLATGSPTALIGATKKAALNTAAQATSLAAETATKATSAVGEIIPGAPSPRSPSALSTADIEALDDDDIEAIADAGLFAEACERERWLDHYGDRRFPGTFYDFKDMTIQFGYVTLFAASFPLASLFAMLNNVLEIRSDAWLLCRAHQRPIWQVQEDIGSWASVIFFISIINTVVNAAITAFVGAQLDDTNGTFTTRIRRADLWMIAVLIEHCVLACKFLVKVILPEEPEWVATAKAAIEYRQELVDGAESLMPRSVQKQRAALANAADTNTSRVDEMHSLLVAWHKADADRSGTLNQAEFAELVKDTTFCKDVTEDELRELCARVDADGDGKIDRAELAAWERSEREREAARREARLLLREQKLAARESGQLSPLSGALSPLSDMDSGDSC